jgi:hypothetical protein
MEILQQSKTKEGENEAHDNLSNGGGHPESHIMKKKGYSFIAITL